VCSGAFDSLNENVTANNHWRARLFAAIDVAVARSARTRRARALGQNDLFRGDQVSVSDTPTDLPDASAWSPAEMLTAEKKALGFYITGHPLDAHSEAVSKLGAISSAELILQQSGSRATIAGLVIDLQLRTTKKGDRFAIFRLEDQAGSIKCLLWPEPFRRYSPLVKDEGTVLVIGRVEVSDEGSVTIIVEKLAGLDQAIQQKARELVIRFPFARDSGQLCNDVKSLLEQSKGDCDVFIELLSEGVLVRLRAHPSLKVLGSAEMEAALRSLGCEVRWEGFAPSTRAVAASGAA